MRLNANEDQGKIQLKELIDSLTPIITAMANGGHTDHISTILGETCNHEYQVGETEVRLEDFRMVMAQIGVSVMIRSLK